MTYSSTTPKKKSLGNISKYKDSEIIFLVENKTYSVLFCTTDLPDKWLIDMVKYKTKTGEIVDDCMITEDDLDHWKSYYDNKGFKQKV